MAACKDCHTVNVYLSGQMDSHEINDEGEKFYEEE